MGSKARTDNERHPERYFSGPEGHPKDRIIVHESAKIPREGLFVGLNGIQYLIKPGVPVDIPRPVRTMLDSRIETETLQGDDGKEHKRNIPRVTYTLVKEDVGAEPVKIPAPEVIAAVDDAPDSRQAEFL